MLKHLKKLFNPPQDGPGITVQADLACAVLLVELAQIDGVEAGEESKHIETALMELFELPATGAKAVLQDARVLLNGAPDIFPYTRILRDTCSLRKRRQIMEALWKMAFADARLDEQEEARLRKYADLLGLTHAEYLQARHAGDF